MRQLKNIKDSELTPNSKIKYQYYICYQRSFYYFEQLSDLRRKYKSYYVSNIEWRDQIMTIYVARKYKKGSKYAKKK